MKNLVKVMALVVLGGTGCGDKSPAEKCEDLVSLTCDRAVGCIAGASGMHDDCVQAFHRESSCGNIKSVGQRYDDCMDMLSEQSCGTLFSTNAESGELMFHLPDACVGVLSTQSVRGEPTPVLRMPTRPVGLLGGLAIQAHAGLE
jgi:hypothetical protein